MISKLRMIFDVLWPSLAICAGFLLFVWVMRLTS